MRHHQKHRDVKVMSPGKAAGLYFAPRVARKATLKAMSPFDCGDYVHHKDEPRHAGRVESIKLITEDEGEVRVRHANGWLQTIHFRDARKATGENQ